YLISSDAVLTVTVPLDITNQPSSQTVVQGANVSFSFGVSGSSPVFSWWHDGVRLTNNSHVSGATSSTVSLSSVTTADAGNYQAIATNLAGSVTSVVATLTVLVPPYLISPWLTNQEVVQGADATFIVGAAPTPLAYQW